jgi:hypothetical protein
MAVLHGGVKRVATLPLFPIILLSEDRVYQHNPNLLPWNSAVKKH